MTRADDVDRVLEWLIGTCWRVKALLDSEHLDRDELRAQMDSAIDVASKLQAGGQ